jgi:hypothetical protein
MSLRAGAMWAVHPRRRRLRDRSGPVYGSGRMADDEGFAPGWASSLNASGMTETGMVGRVAFMLRARPRPSTG